MATLAPTTVSETTVAAVRIHLVTRPIHFFCLEHESGVVVDVCCVCADFVWWESPRVAEREGVCEREKGEREVKNKWGVGLRSTLY
jgi:hypothetical protein